MGNESMNGMVSRSLGILALGIQRIRRRLFHGGRRQLLMTIIGVSLAIGLVVTVTGVSVGLATETSVYGADVDYWIVPESASASTMAVSVGGPALGQVHPTSERIAEMDGVSAASPVAIEMVQLEHGETSEYVLLAGVVAHPDISVLGAETSTLTPGDPLYANGSYDGEWTGEIVISPATGTLLNVSQGDRLEVRGSQANFTVTEVSESNMESGGGPLPTGVVHLSELQTITGQTDGDAADQILVRTTTPAVQDQLAGLYPNADVVARSGAGLSQLSDTRLPLAMALTAFLISMFVGALFVATTMGMEVTGDIRSYATLRAIGVSTPTIVLLVTLQTMTITGLGGVLGTALGYGGIYLSNTLAQQWLTSGPIASYEPILIVYGIGVSLLIGLLAVPYLSWLATRADPLTQLEA